jgi:hypothetical protein
MIDEKSMTIDIEAFAKELFKSAQRPLAWLDSAMRLRDAAEPILAHELENEVSYLTAYADAEREATAEANKEGQDAGTAEIKAIPPNYPPAQLLYAYAIENILKGLMIANAPQLIDERELSKKLKSHKLIELAKKSELHSSWPGEAHTRSSVPTFALSGAAPRRWYPSRVRPRDGRNFEMM